MNPSLGYRNKDGGSNAWNHENTQRPINKYKAYYQRKKVPINFLS